MLSAGTLKGLAKLELVQLEEEGCDVTTLQEEFDALEGADDSHVQDVLTDWFETAQRLRPVSDFPYHEPSDLEGIHAARPEADRWTGSTDEAHLRDRLTGAWLGRCIGCMIGKPVEGRSREVIEEILHATNAYPLSGYFTYTETPDALKGSGPNSPLLSPNITRSVRDDDTDYTTLGLVLIEKHGAEMTPEHVMWEWLVRLPINLTYTAERMAMRNFANEIRPPESAVVMNPYREFIGAQIRADGFGYCAAGRPELAADFCWRDASISHTKNGIYGEMLFGAMIAAATGTDDIHAAIERALAEIPENCRLAEAVRECVQWCDEDDTWEQTFDRIIAKYGHYHLVHTINNALLCIMGLLHGEGDLRRAMCIAVMGGLDTDCNGATVGSVMGALLGAQGVPEDLSAPLNDTLETALSGLTTERISDMVERSVKMALSMPGA